MWKLMSRGKEKPLIFYLKLRWRNLKNFPNKTSTMEWNCAQKGNAPLSTMGYLIFLHFVNNVSSGNYLESGYYPLEDVKKMAIIPWKIEQNLAMNQIWGTNYMSLIIPIILATQWSQI